MPRLSPPRRALPGPLLLLLFVRAMPLSSDLSVALRPTLKFGDKEKEVDKIIDLVNKYGLTKCLQGICFDCFIFIWFVEMHLTPMCKVSYQNFPADPGMFLNMLPNMFNLSALGQVTWHARRVYFGGLPLTANEQTVALFFNQVMAAIGGKTFGLGEAVVNMKLVFEFIQNILVVNMKLIFEFIQNILGGIII
ncbi:hypothetical protein VPH35_001386 [Triticum aestivum]